jgi:hypothetical protein
MGKSGQKVEVTLEDLWVLWSKGKGYRFADGHGL